MSEIDETVDSEIESQEEVTEPQENVDKTLESNEEINEENFSDDADGADSDSEKSDEEITKPQEDTKKKQTKAENSEFAKKRREQEAILKKREDDAYRKGQLDLMIGKTNEFTGEKIEDEDDFNEYLLMKEAEKAGFDPATELSKYQKHKAREERKAITNSEFDVKQDALKFKESYPDIDINDLIRNEDFSEFAEPFAQKIPLSTIYKQYTLMKSKIDGVANHKAEEKYKRKIASPGSLTNNAQEKPLSIADMNDEDFEKLYQKAIRGELRKT